MTHDIALLGAGRIGRIHAANAAATHGLRLTHVVDPFAAAAAEVAASTGAHIADLDSVLADPSVSGIIIASATDTHLDYAVRAVAAGKAVFCEKPIDLDLARATAASSVLSAPDARLFLGFNRRFDPHFRKLFDRIGSGDMGPLETLHLISHDPAPPPIDYIKLSGGLFKDMAIHDFDMACWLLGEEPVEVFASAACLIDPAIGAAGDIDTAKTLLRTASGKLCMISNSRRSGYGYDQRIEAFCAGGLIKADNVVESAVESWTESGKASDRFENFFLDRYAHAYRLEMAHFKAILDDRTTPYTTYADGMAALRIAEAAAASVATGKVVRL